MTAYHTLCNLLHDGKIYAIETWTPITEDGFIVSLSFPLNRKVRGSGPSIDAAQCAALEAYRKECQQ